jgi:8-oxo-dGTP pyrophosphatase MutT (NUDIX family)
MERSSDDRPNLFIGSSTEALPAAKALQNNLHQSVNAKIWHQGTFRLSRSYLGELIEECKRVDFAILIFSADDTTTSRDQQTSSPRDNTVFEAGLFIGALGPERVFAVTQRGGTVKLPTDLAGIATAQYETPRDGRWDVALGPASNKIELEIARCVAVGMKNDDSSPLNLVGPHKTYTSLGVAIPEIRAECYKAVDIKVLANKGLTFIGTDDSILSSAETAKFSHLKKLRVLLLDPNSKWIAEGFVASRGHESVEAYRSEVLVNHRMSKIGFGNFQKILTNNRSGFRLHSGEPKWRIIMTETCAFVSSYADEPGIQVRELPVARFENADRSFYHVFKRHFNDLWHNNAHSVDVARGAMSGGGLVYRLSEEGIWVALLQREDGYWVLPKGHAREADSSMQETARREVGEELGLDIGQLAVEALLRKYEDVTFIAEGERKTVHLFAIRYTGESVELTPDVDHARAEWFSLDRLPSPFLHEAQLMAINDFGRRYRQEAQRKDAKP